MLTSMQSAGAAPGVNLRITQVRKHERDPPWLWNPGQTSPEVQNRGINGPTKRTYVLQKCFKKRKKSTIPLHSLMEQSSFLIFRWKLIRSLKYENVWSYNTWQLLLLLISVSWTRSLLLGVNGSLPSFFIIVVRIGAYIDGPHVGVCEMSTCRTIHDSLSLFYKNK